ncbi:MAG: DHH family phosphoesterase [Bryobacteraceae bacterium]
MKAFRLEAESRFREFLREMPAHGRTVVLGHNDADGLASAAILYTALVRAGRKAAWEITRKGESAWSGPVAERLAAMRPTALIVTDLGSRPMPVVEGVPTLIIDHHRPMGVAENAVLITGYGREPAPSSALLAYWAAQAAADVSDLIWIAAVGIVGDLGVRAPFPELSDAAGRYGAATLQKAASLLNVLRRTATGDARSAMDLLLAAQSPDDLLAPDGPKATELRAAKREVDRALAAAKRAAPKFAGRFALVRIHTPCLVHPLVAQAWRARLRDYIVLVANTGYLPGRVNFVVRSEQPVNLLEILRHHAPAAPGEGSVRDTIALRAAP